MTSNFNCDGSCADCGCHPTESEIYEMAGERGAALVEVERLRAALLEVCDILCWFYDPHDWPADERRIAELRALATASPPAAQSPPGTSDT